MDAPERSYLHEPVEGGETSDAESLGELLVLSSIDLGDGKWRVVLGKHLGGAGILRSELLAMAAVKLLGHQ